MASMLTYAMFYRPITVFDTYMPRAVEPVLLPSARD
jgi:hypothetical protein